MRSPAIGEVVTRGENSLMGGDEDEPEGSFNARPMPKQAPVRFPGGRANKGWTGARRNYTSEGASGCNKETSAG